MFCPSCGKQLNDSKVRGFCPYCGGVLGSSAVPKESQIDEYGQPYVQQQMPVNGKVKNYLTESILVTLLCCLPLGIAGIVNASKVDSLVIQGQYDEAQRLADKAKQLIIIGAISGVISQIIYVFVMIGINN